MQYLRSLSPSSNLPTSSWRGMSPLSIDSIIDSSFARASSKLRLLSEVLSLAIFFVFSLVLLVMARYVRV